MLILDPSRELNQLTAMYNFNVGLFFFVKRKEKIKTCCKELLQAPSHWQPPTLAGPWGPQVRCQTPAMAGSGWWDAGSPGLSPASPAVASLCPQSRIGGL